jgi:hypothetical protein
MSSHGDAYKRLKDRCLKRSCQAQLLITLGTLFIAHGAFATERITPPEWLAHCEGLGIHALRDYDCRAGFARIASKLDEKQCTELGGSMGHNSKLAAVEGRKTCQLKTPDAGRICTDKAQCVAACRAEPEIAQGQETEGRCGEIWGTPPGCINLVSDGRAYGLICID